MIAKHLNPSMTKAEEIAWLQSIAAEAREFPGLYVADLFPEEMIEYIATQINEDGNFSIWERLQYTENQREEAYRDLQEANLATKNAEDRAGMWESTLTQEKADHAEDVSRLMARLNEQDHEMDEAEDKLQRAAEQLGDAGQEIIELKAKLYDLMTAAK